MADGFIVRKGGVADATPGPTISFVSKTENSVTFTITNNSLKARDITYGLTTPPTTTTINLAALATSSNQTISNITEAFVTIFAQAEDSAITEFRVRLDFPIIYTAATGGTTAEYNDGGKRYKSHTFTSNGTFEVTQVGDATDDRNKVDYLIIAGGGGGGHGGGGAGGYRTTNGTSGGDSSAESKVTVSVTSYGVTTGSGGTGGTNVRNIGTSGSNSSVAFPSTITSDGGGGGGGGVNDDDSVGLNGGSGGGGGSTFTGSSSGGTATSDQGRNGGNGLIRPGTDVAGGGGGGAFAVGANGSAGNGGAGGNGLANLLRTGSNETRAGGGGGGSSNQSDRTGGAGGSGGGGAGGGGGTNVAGSSATANTGSGGGGGQYSTGATGNGADGIVVIRYEIAPSV